MTDTKPASTPPPSAAPPAPAPVAAATLIPLDADHTRSEHVRALLGQAATISLGLTLVIVAGVIGALAAGALIGLAAAGGAALAVLLIVLVLASGRAREDFFRAYSKARGLTRRAGRSGLPPATPLLRKGDERYADQVMRGELPGGLAGALGLYTYEEERRDSDGDKHTDYHRFTVVVADLPELAPKVADVYCERRSGFRFLDSAEDAFRRMKRLELESGALDRRYEIFYGPRDDESWLKRLFSPSFIVWLAEGAPEGLAFELSAGSLCVHFEGHRDSAAELDGISRTASLVATRLRAEAAE